MALNVAQVEELSGLLQQVPALVNLLEARRADFAAAVLAWLKQLEQALEQHRQPAVAQIAAARAQLLQAARGQIFKEVNFIGRPTPRKLQDAAANQSLQRAHQVVNELLSERQASFAEAERVARQVVAVAEVKGLVQRALAVNGHDAQLHLLQQLMAADSDLAAAMAHLGGLVGRFDLLVFLDRALPHAV